MANQDKKAEQIRKAQEEKEARRRTVAGVYASFVRENNRMPHRADMLALGFSRDSVRNLFGTFEKMSEMARDLYPDAFGQIIDSSIFTEEAFESFKKLVNKNKRFVVTTAVVGCPAHMGFLKSIRTYCDTTDALLLVLSAADPASTNGWYLAPELGRENIVYGDIRLNSNVFVSTIKLSAKHIDPTTSLDRVGQRNGTFLYASPKQRLKFVPMGNSHPHAIMTTGAITLPRYQTERYMSERTGYIAENDHMLGALIVELDDNEFFHFRQVQADPYGGFVDLGSYYLGDEVSRMDAEGLVLGDWHSGETDPTAAKAWKELAEQVSPGWIVGHDMFNGRSISHHDEKAKIKQALKAVAGHLDLAAELKKFAEDLDELQAWSKHGVVVVKSNHDVFLERYLQECRYVDDPHNHKIAVKLANAMLEGKNPLQYGAELMGLKNRDRIKWLEIDDDFKLAGVQCAAHGHKGNNGAKGSLQGIEKAYGKSTSGHAHTPEILREAHRVGTSSYLKLDYNEGASSWVHCSEPIYSNGGRQLINSFGGRWNTLLKKAPKRKVKK